MLIQRRICLFLVVFVLITVPGVANATVPVVMAGDVIPGDVLAAEEPAVEAPPEAEEEEEQPWTQRYLAPTVLLLGALALGGSILYYMVGIRARYRVKQQ